MVNGYGCYDMTGNAEEWTRTDYSYDVASYPQQEDLDDPRNLVKWRAHREHSYAIGKSGNPIYSRVYNSYSEANGYYGYYSTMGFRVCRRYIPEDESSGD